MADQQPEFSLQPQARPTDQAARPEVRIGPGYEQGKQLQQVSEALRGFSSDVGQIADRRYQAWREATDRQSDQYYLNHAAVLQNQQDLKGAVERGEIPQHANPWVQVRLTQDIAKTQAQTAQSAIYNDLQKSDIFHKDNPQAVSDFIQQRFAQLAQGQDHWGAAAIQPIAQQAHGQLMSRWAEERGQERLGEAHTATGAAVLQAINMHLGDMSVLAPEAANKLPGLISDLQDHYNQLTNIVDKATASKWISDAAFQAGRIHRSADLTREILDGVKGQDGLQLSRLADNKADLETLPREIERLSLTDVQTQTELENAKATREAQNLLNLVPKWQKEQGAAHAFDIKIPTDVAAKTAPLAMQKLQQMIAATSADYEQIKNTKYMEGLEPIQQEAMKAVTSGKLTQDQYVKFGTLMAAYGDPGRSAIDNITKVWNQQRGIAEGITKPEAIAKLNKAAESGTLTTNMVLQSQENHELDHGDTTRYLNLASQVQSEGGKAVPVVQETLAQLTHQVEAPLLAGNAGLPGDRDQVANKVEQAKSAFLSEYFNKLVKAPGWDKLSLTDQHDQIEQLRDTVAKQAGGLSQEDWLKDFKGALAKPFEKPFAAATTQPTPVAGQKPTPQQIAVEPYVAEMDADTLHAAKSALAMKPDATFKEIMEANYGPHGYFSATAPALPPDFYGPRTEEQLNDQSKPLDKYGLRDVTSLKDLRNKVFTGFETQTLTGKVKAEEWSPIFGKQERVEEGRPVQVPVEKKYSIAKGNMPSDFREDGVGSVVQDREIELWKGSMAHLVALKPEAMQAKQSVQSITQQFNQTGKITPGQQAELRRSLISLMAFQDLREQVGYTPDEVKQAGERAWTAMPMFANQKDLKERGEAVGKQIGIQDFQVPYFIKAQIGLMKIIRETNREGQPQQ